MSHIWALVIILVAFGIAGRIDYDVAVADSGAPTCPSFGR